MIELHTVDMKKWWVLFTCALLISIFCLVIFRLDVFANNNLSVNARNWYQNTYIFIIGRVRDEKATIPKYDLPYTIQIQPWLDRYVYTLYGKLIEANKENNRILIKGDDGNEYVVKPSKWLMRDLGWDYESVPVALDQEYVQLDSVPMDVGDRVRVMWDDSRKLSEIMSTYRNTPDMPVNREVAKFFFFTHQNK